MKESANTFFCPWVPTGQTLGVSRAGMGCQHGVGDRGAEAWATVTAPKDGALLSAGACLLAEYVPSVTKRSGCWAENDSWLLEKGWSRTANNS